MKKLVLLALLMLTACNSKYSWTVPECYIDNTTRPAACGPCVHAIDENGNPIKIGDGSNVLFCKKPDNL